MVKEQTIGEHRIRTYFNPSENDDVNVIKLMTAELIDVCERFKDKDPRLAALAQTAYEEACLWAVKAASRIVQFLAKIVFGTLTGVLTLGASAVGILAFFGITPNEAAQTVEVAVKIATTVDIQGLESLNRIDEIIPLLEEYLIQELAK